MQKSNKSLAVEKENEGFRAFLSRVYNYMAGGLALSGIVAYLCSLEPMVTWFYKITPQGTVTYSGLGWVALLSPLLIIFMISSQLRRLNVEKAQMLFWGFAALMGVSLSNIFLLYSGESLFNTFLITAGSFLGLSLYGNSTSRDLSPMGRFMIQGLIGLIIAMIANIFIKSSAVNLAVSILGIIVFAGLTAYDTQKLKVIYQESDSKEERESKAISGALSLYLDFINLFLYLLRFFGNRK
ncbi:MAG: Bax inhibitor-1/YccA family protein [Lactobacillales bacterium]|nr:Bax inhibitor-1/YccA family protein [Lactobacillales bacterium]